jgi:hypothetical protein
MNPHHAKVLTLWRDMLRSIKKLPDPGARIYYRNHAKNQFIQHNDETNNDRILHLVERGYKGIELLFRNYYL